MRSLESQALPRVRYPAKYTAAGLFRCSVARLDGLQCEHQSSRHNHTTCAWHLRGVQPEPVKPVVRVRRRVVQVVQAYKQDLTQTWRSAKDDDAARQRLADFLEVQKSVRAMQRHRARLDRARAKQQTRRAS